MNTPSHLIMTLALGRVSNVTEKKFKAALFWGAILPDIPLYLLASGGMLYYSFFQSWTLSSAAQHIFGSLYFENIWWISLHNFLHAPLMLFILMLSLRYWGKAKKQGMYFLLACAFHSLVDILTHVDDGPVVFFPLEYSYRFHSAVSYWDPKYYGREFSLFELMLNLFLLIYLFKMRRKSVKAKLKG